MEVNKICSALEKLKLDVEQHGNVDSRIAESVTESFYEVEGNNMSDSFFRIYKVIDLFVLSS